ncbi:A-kinase anchor protein 17A-like [Ornithodoros turicata]|uniref:A-kinase anchor protein 17A-like n=1 Tax=Ornithodoros turicata TaxID=34597 RepID=UPI0031399565
MSSIQPCRDATDAVELCPNLGLYLKSIARLNISIQLPQLKTPGKSISNWEVMEKLRQAIKPIEFTQLKISKTTLELIRLEGEVENRSGLKTVLFRLNDSNIKLTGFADTLKVRAAEAKMAFPTRHDWDSYFRDAKHMDEMKPGERPDTMYVQGLPCKWFGDHPSEEMVKRAFSGPGRVRCVDIPQLDPYQKESNSSVGKISTFSFSQELTFDAYIQYEEYMGFVRAMDSLRGMKLVLKTSDGKAYAANIKVDFDKTKHLSEENKRKRELERAKLESLEKEREERVLRERQEEAYRKKQLEAEEEERQRRREEERQRRRRREEERKRREEEERRRKKREEEEEAERRKREEEKRQRKEEELRKREEKKKKKRKKQEEEEQARRWEKDVHTAEETRKAQSTQLLCELFQLLKEEKAKESHVQEADPRSKLLRQEQLLREKLLRNMEARKRLKMAEPNLPNSS